MAASSSCRGNRPTRTSHNRCSVPDELSRRLAPQRTGIPAASVALSRRTSGKLDPTAAFAKRSRSARWRRHRVGRAFPVPALRWASSRNDEDRRAASHRGIEDQRTAGADGQAATGRQGIVIGRDQRAGHQRSCPRYSCRCRSKSMCRRRRSWSTSGPLSVMLLAVPKASVPVGSPRGCRPRRPAHR